MSDVGQPEKLTQNRVIKLFSEDLDYVYLGDWHSRDGNSNIEEGLLTSFLLSKGHSDTIIAKVFFELKNAAKSPNQDLYANNHNFYSLFRYGVQIKPEAGQNTETIQVVDWESPFANDFAIAEEVTIHGENTKRPDIVIYLNGIAIGVIELKRSTVSVADGIRQSITNQKSEFIESFFSTIQFIFAGNSTEGLRYGTIGTPEKYYLAWKEDEEDDSKLLLDKYLLKMCDKRRLIDLLFNFVLFDGGIKKLPRVHQYFGIKAAQEKIRRREGGIIWHTQGSGKSIVMVLLAKWVLENNPNARIAIITDRDELDKQIERVFTEAGEPILRTSSGKDLMKQLSQPHPRLLCSLIHKFGRKDVENFDKFINELKANPPQVFGELFLFVDECHRTQSGKLHRTMKAMLPSAIFIGFTGTPLLKKDKQTSLEVFGGYIHTYKFDEAVEDEVILDLIYEARDVDQKLTSPANIDAWFKAKTKNLNNFQKSLLKKKWGTMQKVLSSKSRMGKIVNDLVFDFITKPRLSSECGNAILVASSIYEACCYYKLFQSTEFKNKCGLVTSYTPNKGDITKEDTGADTETEKQIIFDTYQALLSGKKPETYEDESKDKFIKQPAKMKLLIVVDKLLTGFDAPPCTYMYIDKSMQDHALFQAICRVNRLDTEDKEYGYIVDYKDLFNKVRGAIEVYTEELDSGEFETKDCAILLKERLQNARERLENAREAIELLCEPVEPPKKTLDYIHYFCGNTEKPEELKAKEALRTSLYRATVALVRAYANISDEMNAAGYTEPEVLEIEEQIKFYLNLREEIKQASGETLDLKAYEADMRHLIDNYIQAEDPQKISPFDNFSLIELIVKTGIADAIENLPKGIKGSQEAVAETIENNIRKKIIREHLTDPAFFEKMSKILGLIIKERKENAIEYEKYLQKIADLAKKINEDSNSNMPGTIKTKAQKALYNNLGEDAALALKVDAAIIYVKKADWRGNIPKENEVKQAIYEVIKDINEVERIFDIVKQQNDY